jgi:hypothetical protein
VTDCTLGRAQRRALQLFRTLKILETGRRRIVILDAEALRRRAL